MLCPVSEKVYFSMKYPKAFLHTLIKIQLSAYKKALKQAYSMTTALLKAFSAGMGWGAG